MSRKPFLLICASIWSLGLWAAPALQDFNRSAFYSIFSKGTMEEVNTELALVRASQIPEKEAYEGALLMKKAGLIKLPEEKLKFFKAGRIRFDMAISKEEDNAEYRFIRLTIQEHAPKIVHYNKQLTEDAAMIRKSFRNMSPLLQQLIRDYSSHSSSIHPEDL